MVSINASHAAAGHAAAAAPGHGPKNAVPPSPTPSAPIDADVVDLSPEAVIAAGEPPAVGDRGKSGMSPAHMAKAYDGEWDGPFGQLVRMFAQGTPPLPPAPPAPVAPVDNEIVADVEDPIPPVTDPVEDPVVEAPTPTLDPELIAEATLAEILLNEEDEEEIPTT